MVLLQDGVIAFLSAVGLTAIVWLAAGAILHTGRPTVPGLLLVLPLRGEAPALEEDVRELRRVRRAAAGSTHRAGRLRHERGGQGVWRPISPPGRRASP